MTEPIKNLCKRATAAALALISVCVKWLPDDEDKYY